MSMVLVHAERVDEMSEGKLLLRVTQMRDGDIQLAIYADGAPLQDELGQYAVVEFCNISGGGGRSPHTRSALLALFDALKLDNEADGK